MSDILRQLIHDVEMKVRRVLAELMASESDAPHDLIAALANDQIEVAHAILYLVSDASAMVTGTAIAIDGGHPLGVPPAD